MGYTHYWTIQRKGDQREWADALANIIPTIIEASPCPLEVEYSDEEIVINGTGKDGHESFVIPTVLAETTPAPSWASAPPDSHWDFCKTAQKPYDVVVTAMLAALAHRCPAIITVTSDGDAEEWEPGLTFAHIVLDDESIGFPCKEDEEDSDA